MLLLLCAPACDDPPATPSDPPVSLSGTWRGGITVNGVQALMTWTLTHTDMSVNGPALVTLPTGLVLMNGALSGTVSGTVMTYTIAIPAGGIPTQPACSGLVSGAATVVSASSMNGTYSLTSSTCPTGLAGGTFTLTK